MADAIDEILLAVGGIIGGCSAEQLSEVMALNEMSVDALELVMGHNDSYINEGGRYSYREVNAFCTESGESPLQPGIQFDGAVASPAVMELQPGMYDYTGEGQLLLYPDGKFLLKFPEARDDVRLTDGPDLYNRIGIVGCSTEQLSEVIAKNELSIESFELVNPVN